MRSEPEWDYGHGYRGEEKTCPFCDLKDAEIKRLRDAIEWACDHQVMSHHHMIEECKGGISEREWKYFATELRRRAEERE